MSSLWNKMVMCVESASVVMVMLPARRRNANRLQDACSTRRVRHSAVLHAKTQEQVCLIFTRHTGANRNFYIIMSYMWLLQKNLCFVTNFWEKCESFFIIGGNCTSASCTSAMVSVSAHTDDDIVCWMLGRSNVYCNLGSKAVTAAWSWETSVQSVSVLCSSLLLI